MTKQNTILLMKSKLRAFKAGYFRAIEKKDLAAAEKWKDGCIAIQDRIAELKED